jgi:asparagine synthase (glutamine-hydrolysing)
VCGINGRFNLDGQPVSEAEIIDMRDILNHRGPDDAGLYVNGSIGLGHRRLSIIDLSGGHQPINNEDGSLTIVFNGEIYNFQELREELLARDHVFKTRSDTEVVVHLYEEMGIQCLERLRGMFAFALWDAKRQQLFLARDRLGEKPLYYAAVGRSLIFASEIKALLRVEGVRATVSPVGLRRYLTYRFPYGNTTLFQGVNPLTPGSYIVADTRGWQVRRYWDLPLRAATGVARTSSEQLLMMLEQSVVQRMISDVPIGAFLSGGLDSSVITALMARRTHHVRTFSIGFVPGDENELAWARRMAESCGALHHEFLQGSEDFFTLMQKLIWHHDEPLTFPASIPLYLLALQSKRVATVMLAGEGADELLGGYRNNIHSYWLMRAAGILPTACRRALGKLRLPARMAAIAQRTTLEPQQVILGAFRIGGSEDLIRHCRIDLPNANADDAQLLEEIGLPARDGSFLDRLLYSQLKTYLIALLMKQDKMSMAASIETRVPYLDHDLVEYAFSLGDSAKIRGRTGKYVLRQASEGLLPREIIHRPKQGFPVPVAHWFRAPGNPFIEILLDPESLRDGLLDGAYVRERVRKFLNGDGISIEIWAMLNLELWRRTFLKGAQ